MLNLDQRAFFARNGFIHLCGSVPEKICDELVDLTWERLPESWSRNDPTTWKGVVSDTCHTGDIDHHRGHLRFQRGNLIGSSAVDGGFGPRSAMAEACRSLLGTQLGSLHIRGLYVIAPLDRVDELNPVAKPHIEAHATQLVALCYLDDVGVGGGGLLVWPGSHKALYPTLGSKLEFIRTPQYEDARSHWGRLEPVEVSGRKGDVVLIHHRLLHAPSLNRSKKLRLAFLCDYRSDGFEELCGEAPAAIWEDWPGMRSLDAANLNAPSDYHLQHAPKDHRPQKLGLNEQSTQRSSAAALVRLRVPGDIWLTVSDSPMTAQTNQLDPKGSRYADLGVKVRWGSKELQSLTDYDFVSRLQNFNGRGVLQITNLQRPAWLRVIKIRSPFCDNEVLHLSQLKAGDSSHALDLGDAGRLTGDGH